MIKLGVNYYNCGNCNKIFNDCEDLRMCICERRFCSECMYKIGGIKDLEGYADFESCDLCRNESSTVTISKNEYEKLLESQDLTNICYLCINEGSDLCINDCSVWKRFLINRDCSGCKQLKKLLNSETPNCVISNCNIYKERKSKSRIHEIKK